VKPKIISKDAFLVAGVTGSGDETAKAWEAFTKLNKINPLTNKTAEEGYEIRIYPAECPGEIHVGMPVKDTKVPAEYKVVKVPASLYAEFEIYPSKGYESSNAKMNKWLAENASIYKEAMFNGKHFAIEVYDKRYKGDKDPASVVACLVPVARVK
jgi:predicted transcriptional regulator YdeE